VSGLAASGDWGALLGTSVCVHTGDRWLVTTCRGDRWLSRPEKAAIYGCHVLKRRTRQVTALAASGEWGARLERRLACAMGYTHSLKYCLMSAYACLMSASACLMSASACLMSEFACLMRSCGPVTALAASGEWGARLERRLACAMGSTLTLKLRIE